jgi:hypothetical protein
MNADAFAHVGGGSAYPASPEANDDVLPTPGCNAGAVLTGFWLRPDSLSFIYECGSKTYFEGTTPLPALAGYQVVSAGAGRSVLYTNGADDLVNDSDGGMHFVSLGDNTLFIYAMNPERVREVRSTATGFLVMRGSMFSDNEPCWLKLVTPDGNVTMIDYFSATGFANSCTGRIDSLQQLYTPIFGMTNNSVLLRPVTQAGATSTVYTDVGAMPTTYTTYPPHAFTFMPLSGSLVTGP